MSRPRSKIRNHTWDNVKAKIQDKNHTWDNVKAKIQDKNHTWDNVKAKIQDKESHLRQCQGKDPAQGNFSRNVKVTYSYKLQKCTYN